MRAYKPDMYCTGRNFSFEMVEKEIKAKQALARQIDSFVVNMEGYLLDHPEAAKSLAEVDREYEKNN